MTFRRVRGRLRAQRSSRLRMREQSAAIDNCAAEHERADLSSADRSNVGSASSTSTSATRRQSPRSRASASARYATSRASGGARTSSVIRPTRRRDFTASRPTIREPKPDARARPLAQRLHRAPSPREHFVKRLCYTPLVGALLGDHARRRDHDAEQDARDRYRRFFRGRSVRSLQDDPVRAVISDGGVLPVAR
jgi:hypothetical protein